MLAVWLMAASAALAQGLHAGEIIDPVACTADPTQSYALYLPAAYSPSRSWPIIFAFDAGGRGRTPVERYREAAERYGYIVVGSNNSRNGSTEIPKILAALTDDVSSRFAIDPNRVYMAGMSGGARVAFRIALASPHVAGVIASSAGYPDSQPRKTLPFPVFATAGTEDFNHLEMRTLDRTLTSPHRLIIFEGGHVWLSSELAMQAVEWMELQAMKSGRKPRDENEIDHLFAVRKTELSNLPGDKTTFLALQAIVDVFQGLRGVTDVAARAAELSRSKSVRAAIKTDFDNDSREEMMLREFQTLAGRLASSDRAQALSELRQRWTDLAEQAKAPADSGDRQLARRVLAALSADGTTDPDYSKIIAQYRGGRGRQGIGPNP